MRIGYFLQLRGYTPPQFVEQARLAEEAGFEALWISDHFHPWNDAQGQSPFVWGVIGAISQVCRLPVTTAVTAPTVRLHPAIVAQAAATARRTAGGSVHPRRRHRRGAQRAHLRRRLAERDVRLEMLEEAIQVIRELWQGEFTYHYGKHYTVENARIYTRPAEPPQIFISAFGDKSFDLALRIGDGFITTQPDAEHVSAVEGPGGHGKPAQAGYKVCVADTEDEGVKIAHQLWANAGLPGELSQVLPVAEALRAGQRAGHRGHDPRVNRVRQDVDRHVEAFGAVRRRRASTTSTSPTWVRTTATSSRCTATRCSPASAPDRSLVIHRGSVPRSVTDPLSITEVWS